MDFLHCNACGHNPMYGEQRNYYLTNCGHVFCQNCNNKIEGTCHVCKAQCRLVQVSSDSKSEIKAYFMDPMELFKINMTQSMTQLLQVMTFQKTQFKSYAQQVGNLMERNKALRSEIELVKSENAQLSRRMENMQNCEQNWIGHGVGGVNRPGHSPRAHSENQGGFLQQPIDPAFSSIFGEHSGSGHNLELGEKISSHRNQMQPASPSDSRSQNSLNARGNSRLTIPLLTPIKNHRESLMSRYSPTVGQPNGNVYQNLSTPRTPRPISSGSHYKPPPQKPQTPNTTTTPDIVARLKKLRW